MTGRVVAGDLRFNIVGAGGGVGGVEEFRGGGSGGVSLKFDGHCDGLYCPVLVRQPGTSC